MLAASVFSVVASQSFAWGHTHCYDAQLFVSSGTMIKHCGDFLPPDGLISRGKHKNKKWKDAFPNHKFTTGWKLQNWKRSDRTKRVWFRQDKKIGHLVKSMMTKEL